MEGVVTFIGPEGSGKSTMCQMLARRMGGTALVVPEWPALQPFLRSPADHAFAMQTDALSYTMATYRDLVRTPTRPIFADICPDRIHHVLTWRMFSEGLLSVEELAQLERQYLAVSGEWSPNYVYLRVGVDALAKRLAERSRPEDAERNVTGLAVVANRWEQIVADPDWRRDKNVLEVDGERNKEEVCAVAEAWVRGT